MGDFYFRCIALSEHMRVGFADPRYHSAVKIWTATETHAHVVYTWVPTALWMAEIPNVDTALDVHTPTE